MSILDEIVESKRATLAGQKQRYPEGYLRAQSCERGGGPRMSAALREVPMGLIAEVKRRSPSAGIIREPFSPAGLAAEYVQGGAQAISVLIDHPYFGGSARDLVEVRTACRLPLLYKEFVVDAWQVWHAASLGAAAVLLIAAVLDDKTLRTLSALCDEAGVEALVEVHDEEEMGRAVDAGAAFIGINNRDLKTFEVDLDTSLRLAALASGDCTLVSESGIRTAEDVGRLEEAGFHGVLVGEHLLRQPRVSAAVRELMGESWASL
jgi:indole-3-glycerol phosphate synthase